MNNCPLQFVQRKKPAPHLCFDDHNPPVVFVTVCTKNRFRILASARVHEILRRLWHDRLHWVVGIYMIMPDHIHLLVRVASRTSCSLKRWVQWWKRELSKEIGWAEGTVWQSSFWDRNLFSPNIYSDKIRYVRENPVRAGLVATSEEWPYQGLVYQLGSLDR
jgi:REP element-mobilizing transposase RayT